MFIAYFSAESATKSCISEPEDATLKFAPAIFFALVVGAMSSARAAPVVFSAPVLGVPGIQATVDAFRLALGAANPNVAGSFGTGRREITWDGVRDPQAAPNNLPANFFNINSPRGVVLSTPGSGFQVSANSGVAPIEFGNINATYSGLFQTFSAQRLFTALDSNITDVNFFVPGSATAATVSAFGAVFTDVDLANSTSLQFFDLGNVSLGEFFVPVGTSITGNESLSFLGVRFDAGKRVGRVRITSGNAALGGNDGGGIDLVVMDDFIYAEPTASVPEPATLLLVGPLLAALWILRRRRLRYGQQEDSLRRLRKVTSRW